MDLVDVSRCVEVMSTVGREICPLPLNLLQHSQMLTVLQGRRVRTKDDPRRTHDDVANVDGFRYHVGLRL